MDEGDLYLYKYGVFCCQYLEDIQKIWNNISLFGHNAQVEQ